MTTKIDLNCIFPGSFIPEQHWYPKAYRAGIHPLVACFFNLSGADIAKRYCQRYPQTKEKDLIAALDYRTQFYKWSGADLIYAHNDSGVRKMLVIENNSCPSGQKSMPLLDPSNGAVNYEKLIRGSFIEMLENANSTQDGVLAVIYDKNYMEASAYAHVIADLSGEAVYLIFYPEKYLDDSPIRISDNFLHFRAQDGSWKKVRAAFRYLTQKPWNRIPVNCRSAILNPISACLAGGRNKLLAARAYERFNAKHFEAGLLIHTPHTALNVALEDVPLRVNEMGGQAVVKNPYSNAAQGVYPIMNASDLKNFMNQMHGYYHFVVQDLIGSAHWSNASKTGNYFHVGTLPDEKGNRYVCDMRMMVCSSGEGFRPLCMYGRRAQLPMRESIGKEGDSAAMLITNLSRKIRENEWETDVSRLILMDTTEFSQLDLGLDELIEAYVQAVFSTIAIDDMIASLSDSEGAFQLGLFKGECADAHLLQEIFQSHTNY